MPLNPTKIFSSILAKINHYTDESLMMLCLKTKSQVF